MYSFIKTWLALNSDKRAVTALEYGLIAAVIAGVTATAFSGIGTHLNSVLGTVNTSL
jgi:pilus assembly protein Flp/PilA